MRQQHTGGTHEGRRLKETGSVKRNMTKTGPIKIKVVMTRCERTHLSHVLEIKVPGFTCGELLDTTLTSVL